METKPAQGRMLKSGDVRTRDGARPVPASQRPKATTSDILNGPRRTVPPRLVIDTDEKRGEGD